MSDIHEIHARARNWAAHVEQLLKASTRSAGAVDTGHLQQSINERVAVLKDGESLAVSFGFSRYGVFVEKGAGKGKGGKKGSAWYDKAGVRKRTSPTSLGKMNTGARRAQKWFNPILKNELPRLADAVAQLIDLQAQKALIK